MIRGLIFDYGGTLDSRGDHWSEVIWEAYLSQMNEEEERERNSEDIGDVFAHIDREEFRAAYVHAERALEESGIILPSDTFLDVMRKKTNLQLEYLEAYTPQRCESIALRCYNSARVCVEESKQTLRELSQHYPIVIVSNFYGNLQSVIEDFGLSPYVSAAIDSTVVGIRKPDPAIFALGLEALAEIIPNLTPEEVIVVGDSIANDILPAHSLGCRTVLLPGKPWDSSRRLPRLPRDTFKIKSIGQLVEIIDSMEENMLKTL